MLIDSQGEQAVITGDMMHHPIQLAIPATDARFDMDKEQGARTRRDFVQRFGNNGTLVIGSHFAIPPPAGSCATATAWKLEHHEAAVAASPICPASTSSSPAPAAASAARWPKNWPAAARRWP